MFNLSKFAEQLSELMTECDYNQSALAKVMNTPRPKLSNYLRAKNAPNFKDFVAIIEFFNCSADFLLGLSDNPERERKFLPVGEFGAQLRKVLSEKGVSQYALKNSTRLSWSVLHAWLRGTSLPSLDNLVKVAEKLDCSVDYLIGRE